METLLPSEIARLVYGYLVDQKCESAASSFLANSLHLGECYEVSKRGRKFNTRVAGLSLLDILERFTDAVCVLKSYSEKKKTPCSRENTEDVDETGSLLADLSPLLLNCEAAETEASKKKTVFLKLTLPEQKTSSACSNTSSQAVEPPKDGGRTEELEGETEKERRDRPSLEEGSASAPPQSSSGGKNASLTLDESLFHMMLENTELHHRLAENVEKVKDSSGGEVDGTGLAKKVVNDPDFEELLHMLTDSLSSVPKPEDGTSPEDTDKENGEPEGMGKTVSAVSSKENDTLKKIEVQNNSAVEEILAVNKRALEENSPVNVSRGNLIQNKVSCMQTLQIAQQVPIVTTFPAAAQPIVLETVSSEFDLSGFRKILPKPIATVTVVSDPLPVVETQQTFIGSSPSGCLKPRGARTRGGVRGKRGSRGGVRSITPQLSHHISDNNISVVFIENDRYMRTRAMSKRQDNNWTLRPVVDKLKIAPELGRSEEQPTSSQSTAETDGSKLRTPSVEESMDVAGSDNQPVSSKNVLKSKRSPKSRMESEEKDSESTGTAQIEETQASESTTTVHIEEKEESESEKEDSESTATVQNEETLVSEVTANAQNEEAKDSESTATAHVEENDASGSTTINHIEEAQASESTENAHIEEMQATDSTGTANIEETQASESTTAPHVEKAQDSESTETVRIEETVNCEDTAPSTVENNLEAVSVTKSLSETTESNEIPPEEMASHSGEETPDQPKDLVQNKNKISLSTPRRGSHVRVLDFITPDKSVASRKAYTSPKEYSKAVKLNTSLDKAKREIFKSKFDTPNSLPPKTGTSNESKLPKILEDEEVVSESIVAIREEFAETHKILPRPLRKPSSKLKSLFKNKSPDVKTTDEIKTSPKKVSWDEDIRKFANITTSGCIKKKNNVRKTCKRRASPKGRDPKPTKRKTTRKIDSPETDDVVSPDNKKLKTLEKLNRSSKCLGLSTRNKRKKQNVSAAFCDTDDSSDLETSVGVVPTDVKETNPEGKIGDGSEIVESSVVDKRVEESGSVSAPLTDKKDASEMEIVVDASTDDSKIYKGGDLLNSSADNDILNSSTIENQTKEFSSDFAADVEKQNSFEVNSQKMSDLEINVSETPCKLLNGPRHLVEGTPVSRVLESAAKFSSTSLVTPSLPLTPKPRDDTTPEKSMSTIQKTVSISSDLDNVDIIVDPGKNDQFEDIRGEIVLTIPPQCNQTKKSVKTVIDDNDDDDDDDEESLFESLNLRKLNQNKSKSQSGSQKQKLRIYTSSSSESTESSEDRTSCKVDEVSDKAKEKELFGDHSLDSSDEDLPPPPVRPKRRGRPPKNVKNVSNTKNKNSKKDEVSNKQSKKTSDNVNIVTEITKSSEDTVSIGKEKHLKIADVESEECIRPPLDNEIKSSSNCADKVEVRKETLASTDSVGNDTQNSQNENSCKRLFGGLFDQPAGTTPLKNPVSEEVVTNNVQLTPFSKIILNQLGQMSPCSNSMLESVLIQEGSRLELENKIQNSVNLGTESDKGDSAVLKEAIKDITPLPTLENSNVVSSQIDAVSTEDGSKPKVPDQRNEQQTVQKSSVTYSPPDTSEKSVHNKRKSKPSKLCKYTSDECTKPGTPLRTIKDKGKCKLKKDKTKNSTKNVTPTKPSRGTTKKPKLTPDKSLEKIEEEVLKECLAKAKAQSKMSSPPKSRSSLSQYAFDKLKKIQNNSILSTSSSSDEDNSLQINLVQTSKNDVLSPNVRKKSIKASVIADQRQGIPSKTSEPSKRLTVVDDSIPTLHLSEEGHMSVTTDGTVQKLSSVISPKVQKENDLSRKQVSKSRNDLKSIQDNGALSIPEYCSKSNKDKNVPNSIQERGFMKNQEDKSEGIQGNNNTSPENVKSFDFISETTAIPEETPSFSKYLNRYSYTFLFNDCDEEGTGSSITLRSSPFLNVFEIVSKESRVAHKTAVKLQASSPEVHHRPPGHSSGSQGSSKSSESMKSPFSSSRRQHATRYESPERSKPHKARDRSPERRLSSKKRRFSPSSSEDERREPGFHPHKKKRHLFRDSFRHSFARPRLPSPPKYFKSRFDRHRRHHVRSPSSKTSHHQLDRRREHHGKSSNTKSRPKETDDKTHKSTNKRVEASRYPPEEKYGKKTVAMELEEGELSNSSDRSNALRPGPEPSANEAKRKGLESLLSEEGRALLKGVDLETFLTALHGSEKDSN